MSYFRSTQASAEREAVELTATDPRHRYEAARIPDGRPGPDAELRKVWPWGVARYERGYHKDGSERFAGYVWSRLPS